MSALERDMVLENLRKAYEIIRFADGSASAPVAEPEESEDEPEFEIEFIMGDEEVEETDEADEEESVAAVVAPVAPAVEELVEEPAPVVEEPVAEVGSVEEPAAVEEPVAEVGLVEEPAAVEEPVAEPVAVEEPSAPVVEEPAPAEEPQAIDEDLEAVRPVRRSAIVSLYGDEAAAEGERVAEEERIVGDIFRREASTPIGETIPCPQVVSTAPRVESLKSAIGVADRFMIIRELFGGDGDAYNATIERLDAMSSFDDCVIYITENYSWQSSSEAAKLIMSLLQRKYQA